MTVEDNILLSCINKKGNPEVNNKMNRIVGKMQLDKDINKLPQGMQSKLGKIEDEGIDISGGQWQKIAIARALLKEVPLYIFDEPTASLDPISECTFYELLLKAVENKTAIWITHRLGVAQLADEILVLDSGNIVERGNHKELMYMNGIYADMFGKEPNVVAIHAGLECGLFAKKIAGLDLISCGPDMFDVHTPDERLCISSTIRVWDYLKEVLKRLK